MTATTPVADSSWTSRLPPRRAALPGCGAPSRSSLQQLPAAVPGEVVDDLVLAVSEAVTNVIRYGSCNLQPVKVAVGVQGGWIQATIRDRAARIPHRSPDEPLRAWAVADRAAGR